MIAPFANLANLPTDYGAWGDFVLMGVVYAGLVFALLYGAVQKLPTYSVGALSFLYPVIAMVVDFVAFDHRLKPLQFVGSAAILPIRPTRTTTPSPPTASIPPPARSPPCREVQTTCLNGDLVPPWLDCMAPISPDDDHANREGGSAYDMTWSVDVRPRRTEWCCHRRPRPAVQLFEWAFRATA